MAVVTKNKKKVSNILNVLFIFSVASPLLLITAPCVFCCRCKICTEIEEELNDLNEGPNSPRRMSRSNSGIAIQIMKD